VPYDRAYLYSATIGTLREHSISHIRTVAYSEHYAVIIIKYIYANMGYYISYNV